MAVIQNTVVFQMLCADMGISIMARRNSRLAVRGGQGLWQ